MRIRSRILLAIPPLFVVLGVITGALAYYSARAEIRWGLREEATSLAVATAEFLAAGGGRVQHSGPALARLMAFGQLHSLDVREDDGNRWRILPEGTLRRLPADITPGPLARPAGNPPFEAALREHGEFIGPVLRPAEGGVLLSAYAAIPGPADRPAGIVAATIDASRLDTHSARILQRFALAAAAMALMGMVVALLLAAFVSRRVGALAQAARKVALGAYGDEIQVGGVQEVNDLGNTLNTLSKVAEDVLWRGRHALISTLGPDDEGVLARAYREFPAASGTEDVAGVQVCCRVIGDGHPGDLVGYALGPAGATAWAGRSAGPESLATAIEAAALTRILQHRLARESVDEVLREVQRLFPLQRLEVAAWRRSTRPEVHVRRIDVGHDATSALQASHCTLDTAALVLMPVAGASAGLLDAWVGLFRHLSAGQLVEDISQALVPALSGPIVALSVAADRPAPTGGRS